MLEGPRHRMCKVRLRDLDLHILEKKKDNIPIHNYLLGRRWSQIPLEG